MKLNRYFSILLAVNGGLCVKAAAKHVHLTLNLQSKQ